MPLFWAAVKAGETVQLPDEGMLFVTQAALGEDVKAGTLTVQLVQGGQPRTLCVLRKGKCDFQRLDLILGCEQAIAEGNSLCVGGTKGEGTLHLLGYLESADMEEDEEEDDEDDEEEDEEVVVASRKRPAAAAKEPNKKSPKLQAAPQKKPSPKLEAAGKKQSPKLEAAGKKQPPKLGGTLVETVTTPKAKPLADVMAEAVKGSPAPLVKAEVLKPPRRKMLKGGLEVEVAKEGKGMAAFKGARVRVSYTGRLTNGKIFDQSAPKQPIMFKLGAGEVIPGWDKGVEGMKVGEKRTLKIPPKLAYGAKGAPPVIPKNATLHFEVELVSLT